MTPAVITSSTCAFVVGTNAYTDFPPLQNGVKDAQIVEEDLRQFGVERIISALDCTYAQLTEKTNQYLSKLREGDVALVYLAAHAAMFQNQHVFLATDSNKGNIARTSLGVQLLLTRSAPFYFLFTCAIRLHAHITLVLLHEYFQYCTVQSKNDCIDS